MELLEYRDYYINEIKAAAIDQREHNTEVFIEDIKDLLINDYGVVSDLDDCFYQWMNGFCYKLA